MKMNNTTKPRFPFPITKAYLDEIFHDCSDFMSREICIGEQKHLIVWLCWMDGLASGSNISNDILRPLTSPARFDCCSDYSHAYNEILKGAVHNFSAKAYTQTDDVVSDLLSGSCVLIFETLEKALSFEARSTFMRSVDQSTMEKSIKGSKEAFIENIRVNTCLVRRKLKTPKLKNLVQSVGEKSDTFLSILYIEGVARFDVVQQLQEQLCQLDIDGLLVPGYLEQLITEQPMSPFPQLLHTERPDTFASMLLEGRVGLLVDGLPVGFLVPAPLSQFMKVTEDTAQHFAVASMLVLLRYLALLVGCLLPGLYVGNDSHGNAFQCHCRKTAGAVLHCGGSPCDAGCLRVIAGGRSSFAEPRGGHSQYHRCIDCGTGCGGCPRGVSHCSNHRCLFGNLLLYHAQSRPRFRCPSAAVGNRSCRYRRRNFRSDCGGDSCNLASVYH